jgi:hypothetical protein
MHGDAYEAAGCFAGRYLTSIILTYHKRVICSFCINFAPIHLHFICFVPFRLRDWNFVSISALCGKCSAFLISLYLIAVTIRGEEQNPLSPWLYSPLNPLAKTKFVSLTHNKTNKIQRLLNTSTFGTYLTPTCFGLDCHRQGDYLHIDRKKNMSRVLQSFEMQ